MARYIISDDEAKEITIRSYNDHINEYIKKDYNDDIRTLSYWPGVKSFLGYLTIGQTIFEIGSGTGSDALRIEREDFTVKRSDVSEAFIKLMHNNGLLCEFYDVLDCPIMDKQTAIYANAVFLHFTSAQFKIALENVYKSLVDGGMFCFSMKLGEFEGWQEKGLGGKRFFKLWNLSDLETVLLDVGFSVINSYITPKNDFVVILVTKK